MRSSDRQNNDDNLDGFTSMIDIVFLLLIFFILQPFKAPEMKMPNELPRQGPGRTTLLDSEEPLRLFLANRDGGVEIRLDGYPVCGGVSGVAAALRHASPGLPADTPVVLDAERNVPFGAVIGVQDQCIQAGCKVLRFAAPPQITTP